MQKFRCELLLFSAAAAMSCAPSHGWFSLGPRPAELAGAWIELGQNSPQEVVTWVLAPDGNVTTTHLVLGTDITGQRRATVRQRWDGRWYLSGRLTDSAHRAICYKRRARDGATCLRFRLDTLNVAAPDPRRLTILGYPGSDWAQPRVFVAARGKT